MGPNHIYFSHDIQVDKAEKFNALILKTEEKSLQSRKILLLKLCKIKKFFLLLSSFLVHFCNSLVVLREEELDTFSCLCTDIH